jgi:hypothetical protein
MANFEYATPNNPQVITLFHGEDYIGYTVGFGLNLNPFKAVKAAANFVGNAVKTSGREIGSVAKTVGGGVQGIAKIGGKVIQGADGIIGGTIGKIPIVGSPLHSVFDLGFHAMMAPANLTIGIISGERIDKAALGTLKQQLQDFKQVAPYAQMVISVVPGVGAGVSASLSAGLALAEGQSIAEVLKAGAIGAIPGGPLVKAAVTMAVEVTQSVASGKKLDLATISQTAGGIASSALGLPIVAKNALVAGIGIMGNITAGKPLDKAVTDGAIQGLPISDQTKTVMRNASALAIELAQGKRIDNALLARATSIAASLPTTSPLSDSIKTGIAAVKKVGVGKGEQVLSAALHAGLGDTLVSMGAQTLPKDVQNGIKAGVGLGSGAVFQQRRGQALNKIGGKLVESGIQLAKTSPVINEARKLASTKGASKGFDIGSGLLQQQVGTFDVSTVRDKLDPTQKLGFDMALATRIGTVANPKPPTLSAAAHAGQAITLGMQSYEPEKKAAIMQTIQSNGAATVGATVAVKEVAANREGWINKLLRALGLRK